MVSGAQWSEGDGGVNGNAVAEWRRRAGSHYLTTTLLGGGEGVSLARPGLDKDESMKPPSVD